MGVIQLTAGGIVMAAGVVLLFWPQPVYWLSDQTNLRAAKYKATSGSEQARQWLVNYPRVRRNLGRLVAAFVFLMGLFIILSGVA